MRQSPRRTPDPQRICADSFPSLPWYDLRGVGSIRIGGLFSRAATAAEASGASWSFDRPSLWRRTIEACDAAGAVVGSFDPRTVRRGGALTWRGRGFELRPASAWKERYALAEDAATVASSGSSATATG